MFGFVLDMLRGMPCPACRRRGLYGIEARAVREGREHDLRVTPRWSLAVCRRCDARCIARRYLDEPYRIATDDEWRAHAYEEIPTARVR